MLTGVIRVNRMRLMFAWLASASLLILNHIVSFVLTSFELSLFPNQNNINIFYVFQLITIYNLNNKERKNFDGFLINYVKHIKK